MIRQEQLILAIDSQKKEFVSKDSYIEREALNTIPIVESYATIITGIRRCGKSTMLLQLLNKNKYNNTLYLNFEDIRLVGFDASDFLKLHTELKKREIKVIVFDEIQLIDKWEIFIHQILREGYKVFITGSNASLLSRELGTNLTGRHISIELFPFSFTEFLRYKKEKPSESTLKEYLNIGGIPEYVKNNFSLILTNLMEDILVRDIAVRHSIKDINSLKQLTLYLISNIGNFVSANKLIGMFGIKSSVTILDFFSYLKDSYLIELMPQFSYSLKAQARNEKKIYAIDMGLITTLSVGFTENKGHKLENLIYLFLRTKYRELFYFKDKGECDFLVFEKGKIIDAIQVCYELNNENFQREYNGLLAAMKFFNLTEGTIVSFNSKDYFIKDNMKINVIPAYEFLTKKRNAIKK